MQPVETTSWKRDSEKRWWCPNYYSMTKEFHPSDVQGRDFYITSQGNGKISSSARSSRGFSWSSPPALAPALQNSTTDLLPSPRQFMVLARLSAIYHSGDRQNINCILADITAGVPGEVRRNYYQMKNNAVRAARALPFLSCHIPSSAEVILV